MLQVGSICILASLDAFFEYMDLTPCNGEWSKKSKSITSPVKHRDGLGTEGEDTRRLTEFQAEERPLAFSGLDTMLGIIDSRYIQHCCPLMMVSHLGKENLTFICFYIIVFEQELQPFNDEGFRL